MHLFLLFSDSIGWPSPRQLCYMLFFRRLTKKRICFIAFIGFAVFCVEVLIYKWAPSDDLNSLIPLEVRLCEKSESASLDCRLLAQQDAKQLARAKCIFQERKQSGTVPDSHYIHSTRHCDRFIRERGYLMNPASVEERNFPLAFSIRMHDNVAQAEHLLRAIYRPHNVYCIHIDRASAPIVQTAMRSIISCFPNVFVSSLYEDFVYRSYSPVKADLQCMRQLQSTGVVWRYYLNLVGTEFPLRTNLELVRVLKRLNGTNDIEMEEFPDYLRFRITYHHLIFWHDLYRNLFWWKRPFPYSNVTIYKGSSYNMFSREFIVWLLGNHIAMELIDWSRDTHSPDETVWATLNGMAGAPGGYVVNSTANQMYLSRAVLWRGDVNSTCQGVLIHNICIFGYRDLKWLMARQEMFANKFSISYDPIAYECLEQLLWQRVRNPDPDHSVDWEYVQKSIDKRKRTRLPG